MTRTIRTPLVMGNWKMHLTAAEAVRFLHELRGKLDSQAGVETAVAPSFLSIPAARDALHDSPIRLGAQNMHWDAAGARTGEVSPAMLKAEGVSMVILGHSERRTLFGETDEMIGKKVEAAAAHRLTPVLCVGEKESERDRGATLSVVDAQLAGGLRGWDRQGDREAVLAYEPVWAIGTGRTPTLDEIQEVHSRIRRSLADLFDEAMAVRTRILYGGSVKPGNAEQIFALPDVDGGLIGGAALQAASFLAIVEAARR